MADNLEKLRTDWGVEGLGLSGAQVQKLLSDTIGQLASQNSVLQNQIKALTNTRRAVRRSVARGLVSVHSQPGVYYKTEGDGTFRIKLFGSHERKALLQGRIVTVDLAPLKEWSNNLTPYPTTGVSFVMNSDKTKLTVSLPASEGAKLTEACLLVNCNRIIPAADQIMVGFEIDHTNHDNPRKVISMKSRAELNEAFRSYELAAPTVQEVLLCVNTGEVAGQKKILPDGIRIQLQYYESRGRGRQSMKTRIFKGNCKRHKFFGKRNNRIRVGTDSLGRAVYRQVGINRHKGVSFTIRARRVTGHRASEWAYFQIRKNKGCRSYSVYPK